MTMRSAVLALWVVVCVLTSWQAIVAVHLRGQSAEGRRAAAALCTFRDDLARRVADSQAFLRSHPDGIPGVPASLIRNSIQNEQATLASLSDLSC